MAVLLVACNGQLPLLESFPVLDAAMAAPPTQAPPTAPPTAPPPVDAGVDAALPDGGTGFRIVAGAAIVEAVPGVRLVHDQTRLIAEAKPYVWTAERDVSRLTLSGSVPLPAARGRLAEAARAAAGGQEVSDRIGFARGAPPRFEAAAGLLLEQLGRLRTGKVSIADNTVRLSGTARDLGGREAIAAALKNLPEGFTVAENSIAALKKMAAPQAKVRRGGQVISIPASGVVVGDILILEAGDLVAADARLLESSSLRCIESSLTGESEAVTKRPATLNEGDIPLGDRENMVFMGTSVAA